MSSKTKTTATKEEATPGLVPRLRFPGFSDPWAHEPLSKVLKEHKLKNTAGRDVFSVSMEYGIVNQIELLGRSFAAADPSHYTIGRCYDVVYTKSPLKAFPFGIVKQCKFDGEVALSPLYGVFTPPNQHLGLMIEAYFESPNRSKDFLSPLCQKGAKNTLQITNTTFLSGRLPLPTQPAEQQKIAECLSSVDELIAAQARKLDALKTHKKGLMQQLFPREGETQPRLRFPEFKNAGEWDAAILDDVLLAASNGLSLPQSADNTGYKVTRIETISAGTIDLEKIGFVKATQDISSYLLNVGDILFSNINSVAHIGKSVYVGDDYGLYHGMNLLRLVVNRHKCDPKFLFYLINTSGIRESFRERANKAVNQASINQTELGKTPVAAPSIPEQQRIATCLSSLDTLITAETQKHEALKTHKKGLMQQLFPSMEEVEA